MVCKQRFFNLEFDAETVDYQYTALGYCLFSTAAAAAGIGAKVHEFLNTVMPKHVMDGKAK